METHKRHTALHVCSEAGGEGGRPGGKTHQHTDQLVDRQRSAGPSLIEFCSFIEILVVLSLSKRRQEFSSLVPVL